MKKLSKNWSNSKLAKKTLLQIGVRIAAIVTLAALISYYHIFVLLNDQVQDSLLKYIIERGEKESIIFLDAEQNHARFKQNFLQQWSQRNAINLAQSNNTRSNRVTFDQLFVPQDDGTVRLTTEAFEGIRREDGSMSRYISAYIGANAPYHSTAFRDKLLLTYQMLDRFGEAWILNYANLYVSMPENVNMVYWPNIPWGTQADSSLDVNEEEWVYIATPENNPAREPVWTGLYYDQTADEWMVSLETPVDFNGEHLINIGHDILLNTLFDRVFNDKLEGTYNFIFRNDSRIIAHPEHVNNLQEHKGILLASDTNDKTLINMIELIRSQAAQESARGFIVDHKQSDSLLAVTNIYGPDWYFVTVYPKSLLASMALSIAYIVAIIGFISLLLELLIFFGVLKRQVLEPVHVFWHFAKSFTKGESDAIETLKKDKSTRRQDEMGELANAMTLMATTIKQHESALEEQVASRTRELHETNLILQRESKERQDVLLLLQTIAKNVSGLQGENYYSTLSSFLANALDADFVIICRLSDDRQVIHTLSATLNKELVDNMSYPVTGTPCEVVINEGTQVFDGNVQELFPDDQDLFDLDLKSYIGTPMLNSSGKCIGHLAIATRGRFTEIEKIKLIVDSVSSRASSELIRQVNEEVIIRQATTDALTQLPNRSAFMAHLRQSILHAHRSKTHLAAMFIDLDGFKLVNDRLGHAAGDELLILVANRLRESVRSDDFIARMGGDEFIVLLDSIKDMVEPEVVAQKILNNLSQETTIFDTSITISGSIGIAIYPEDGANDVELIKNADRAMYRAKELGKNNVQFFTVSMNERLEKNRQIEHDLRQAIAHQEFIVFYQPIVCLRKNKTKKMEALVRWQHPEHGMISPDDFIPVAEQSGQIVAIGEMVLNQVCKDFSTFKQYYPELLSIAVNFSAKQFREPEFSNYMMNVIKKNNIKNENIEIEITESFFIDKEDNKTIALLYYLREQGFKIALDDFGTGYSSLGYLKQFPVDTLKIDRTFVRDVSSDEQNKALVNSIIDLAQNFKLTVVAEGVENEAQEFILKLLDCDFAQGYFYSPPKCREDLVNKAENTKKHLQLATNINQRNRGNCRSFVA